MDAWKTTMEENKNTDGWNINIYSPGNFIAREIRFEGTVNIGGKTDNGGYSDEQVAKALLSIVGEGLPIDAKWKWAGAYWWLRWACAFPVDVQLFCKRIKGLPWQGELAVKCDYNDIRRVCNMSFIEQDPRRMDIVQPKSGEGKEFASCREVALKLAEALGKAFLPEQAISHLPI